MVAYELGIHGIQVGWKVTPPPGAVVPHPHGARRAARDQAHRRPLPPRATTHGKWRLLTVPPERQRLPEASACPTAARPARPHQGRPLEVIGAPQQPQAAGLARLTH